jgi:hypothetical protein
VELKNVLHRNMMEMKNGDYKFKLIIAVRA